MSPRNTPPLDLCRALGRAIAARRAETSDSQLACSLRAGVTRPVWARLEAGRKPISMLTLYAVARALHVPASELLRRAEEIARARRIQSAAMAAQPAQADMADPVAA